MTEPSARRGLSLTRQQRDSLYGRIYRNLAGVDALWHALSEREFEKAARLSHELVDVLTFVMDDLGWGERIERELFQVTSSGVVVRRVLQRLRDEALELEPVIDVRASGEENRRLIDTCNDLLRALDGMEG